MKLKGLQFGIVKKIILIAIIFGLFYSLYDGFFSNPYEEELKQDASKQQRILKIDEAPKEEQYAIRAQLQPLTYTTLSSEIPARIQKIKVREGENFKEGQLLIKLDCTLQEAQFIKAKAQFEAAKRTYEANKDLYKLDAIGKIELENSYSESEKARGEFILISTTVSKCNIYAPFAGKVAEQKAREEQYVQPGQALIDILDGKEMEIEFLVPSKWLSWLTEKTTLTIHIDETNHDYPARIKSIGAKSDAISQSVKIVAVIDIYPELSPGMSGEVKLDMPPDSKNLDIKNSDAPKI